VELVGDAGLQPTDVHEPARAIVALSDDELEQGLRQLLNESARVEVQIARFLVEVEERRLHLRAGFSSLYEYCRVRLGLSEFEAYFRIGAARTGRKFPLVFELLAGRAVHLTTLHLLRDYLTPENHRELLQAASHKSKRQVAELLAERFPRADVAATLKPLPVFDPLSPGRYRLELTIGAALKLKLEHARDLLSHANPTGDLEVVMERALDLLIDQLERRRFATTLRPSPERSAPVSSAPVAPARATTETKTDRSRPHIANAVRRHVAIRDERRCTFVGPGGHRCDARGFLQLHHERPFALGGADTPDNLRLLCAAHNRFLAELCPVAEHGVRTPAPQACPEKPQAPEPDEPQKKAG
jgi:hypothetical protein